MKSYCVRCRRATETLRARHVVSRNGRRMMRGKCSNFGSTTTRFVQKGGYFFDLLNVVTNRIKLPWAKFRGEMHLPRHNFTGPGTKLDKRLNPDGTPKPWSRPVDMNGTHEWHNAIIAPVFKKGIASAVSNYRPISLTCVASKIMERVVSSQIYNYLCSGSLLSYN